MKEEKNSNSDLTKEQEEFKKLLADVSNSGLSCLVALSALFLNPCFKFFVDNYFKPETKKNK